MNRIAGRRLKQGTTLLLQTSTEASEEELRQANCLARDAWLELSESEFGHSGLEVLM